MRSLPFALALAVAVVLDLVNAIGWVAETALTSFANLTDEPDQGTP